MDILRKVPWLEGLSYDILSEISSSFEDVVFNRDEILVEQDDDSSDNVHVLARGKDSQNFKIEASFLNVAPHSL